MKGFPTNLTVRRVLLVVVFAISGIILLAVAGGGAFYYLFMRSPAAPDLPPPANQQQANRQDLEYLLYVMKYDRSFSTAARAGLHRSVDELLARVGDLDSAALEMGIARAVALADNAHTNAREAAWGGRRLNALPLRFALFAEGIFVVKADPSQVDLLGARLVSEGGHTVPALMRALRPYVGGPDALHRELSPNLLQSPQALHAIGLLPSSSETTLVFEQRDGSRVERTIAARVEPTLDGSRPNWPKRSLSPQPTSTDQRVWAHVLGETPLLPLYLRNPDRMYWHAYVRDLDAVYVQINGIRDQGDTPLSAYLADVVKEIGQRRPRHAIVDLRFAPGGNYLLTADFTKQLPDAIPTDGKVFIITSGNTFSAALVTAARLKYFAADRGVIVGEPMGDREQFWAEGRRVSLPNSKIVVRYSTGYHDWQSGCAKVRWSSCYWPNFWLGVPAGTLAPAIPAPLQFSDYIAGRDSAFEAVKARLEP